MEPREVAVADDEDNCRFVFTEEGFDGELIYRVEGDRLVLLHAEVAPALRGQGLAGHLVQAALDRARSTGETVAPWCGYTRRWLEENSDKAGQVTIDWRPPFAR